MRDLLPPRRASENFTITFQGERYDVTIGHYDDVRVGEIFITRARHAAAARGPAATILDGVCRDSAILMSLAIQHGVDLTTIQHAVTRDDDGDPATIVGAIVDHLALSPESPTDEQRNNNNAQPDTVSELTTPLSSRVGTIYDVPSAAERFTSGSLGRGEDLSHRDPDRSGD